MGNADTEPSAGGASGPADDPGRAALVAAELVRAQYRNIPTAVAVNAIIAALLCLALQETVSLGRLIGWLAAIYVVAATRFLVWYRFNRTLVTASTAPQWRRFAPIPKS